MGDDEIEESAADPVGLGEPEQRAEADAVVDEDVDHREAEDDSERHRGHRDVDVVEHDQAGRRNPDLGRDVGPELVVMHLVDELRRGEAVSRIGVSEHNEIADDRGHE